MARAFFYLGEWVVWGGWGWGISAGQERGGRGKCAPLFEGKWNENPDRLWGRGQGAYRRTAVSFLRILLTAWPPATQVSNDLGKGICLLLK